MTSDIGAPRTLHADARKWLGVLAIGAGFVAIGIAMILTKGDFLAWFCTLFFGLVTGVAAIQLLGAGSKLDLNADTFTVTNFGRVTTERWDECASFKVYRTSYTEQVCYDRARDVDTHMGEMNRTISGRTAGLPDTFGMSAKDLANLMNAYQAKGVERSWQYHAEAVAKVERMIADRLAKSETAADIMTDPAAMSLPEGMPPWPAIIAAAKQPRPDGSRHVLIAADILSPLSRWITEATKRDQAFKLLQSDELQIINPETDNIRCLLRDNA